MKTDFLKALGISDEQAAEILKENGKDIEKHKATAEVNLAKVAELSNQLAQRDKEFTDLQKQDANGLKAKLDALQASYDTDKDNWTKQEAKRAYEQRRGEFFSDVEFVSDYAKRGVMAEFDEKAFAYDEQSKTFSNAADWLNGLKAKETSAFKQTTKPPVVVRPTDGTLPSELTKEQFNKMGYASRLALKRDDPEQYKNLKE